MQAVLTEVDAWPIEDRIRLVQEIWDRLAGQGHELELSPEIKAEIDRRLAAHEANPAAATPWEQMEAETMARLGS